VVCDGNICRSPSAAALLRTRKPGKIVKSAGLVALEGHEMDEMAKSVASENGLDCGSHTGQKLSSSLCMWADLILVMERRQRDRLIRRYPEASGKTFLLTHWSGLADIPDPYRRTKEAYERIYSMIVSAVDAWSSKL